MGGTVSSRPQFQRSSSFNYGRSSQRGLFQKSKVKLKQIDKKLQSYDGTKNTVIHDEIKKQLEDIDKELKNVSAEVKQKNRNKYEETFKYLQEVSEKFESMAKPVHEGDQAVEEADKQEVKGGEGTDKEKKWGFGMGSQRGLFRKSNAKLKELDKKLEKVQENSTTTLDEIKKDLESIQRELNTISAVLKDKYKKQYEDAQKHLQEAQEKLQKTSPQEQKEEEEELTPEQEASVAKSLELKLVEDLEEDEEVEMRRSSLPTTPKVKFGVPVMPSFPRISQDLLKRKTLPVNEGPKAEFERMRIMSDSSFMGTSSPSYKQNVSLKLSQSESKSSVNQNGPPSSPIVSEINSGSITSSSPSEKGSQRGSFGPKKPPRLVREPSADETTLQQIESIVLRIDKLEQQLKYFNGTKEDIEYIVLREKFIKMILNLDNIETNDNSVVKQERKLAIMRVQDLFMILDRLAEQNEEIHASKDKDLDDKSLDDKGLEDKRLSEYREENINAEGKPVAATAL